MALSDSSGSLQYGCGFATALFLIESYLQFGLIAPLCATGCVNQVSS